MTSEERESNCPTIVSVGDHRRIKQPRRRELAMFTDRPWVGLRTFGDGVYWTVRRWCLQDHKALMYSVNQTVSLLGQVIISVRVAPRNPSSDVILPYSKANGSARVKMGRTEVIASVKAELGRPSSSAPGKGKVSIFVDCSPTAAPQFEGRGGEELSMELSAALRQCLLGGKSGAGGGINLSSLSIVDGKVCWDLYIDGLVVSMDGNVLDALGAAIKAALSNTGIPKVNIASATTPDEQPEVDVSDEEFLQFDTTAVPVIVTLTKVGRHYYIADATSEEESQMSSAVSVSVNQQGSICGLTKRGGAGLDPSVIVDMISVAKHVSEELMNKLDSEIAAAEAMEEDSS
ncbi:hypothetical protein M8C21_024610 [Ambrosia artemisiifolia]|uniref:Ribosomal RNA-processing protein 42 n=1 Tax=Ambrosia artemisiifolia TaxID=4212 RepID=A0AAD5CUJ9_AMBAR|nr:hypothetical protein M8C21_024610 [Ambrosia artemisiifolia]